jgi:hypothetical protein
LFGRKGVFNVIGSAIAIVLLVTIITSVVMPTLKNAPTTGWTGQELAIWNTLGVFVILGVLVAIAGGFLLGMFR